MRACVNRLSMCSANVRMGRCEYCVGRAGGVHAPHTRPTQSNPKSNAQSGYYCGGCEQCKRHSRTFTFTTISGISAHKIPNCAGGARRVWSRPARAQSISEHISGHLSTSVIASRRYVNLPPRVTLARAMRRNALPRSVHGTLCDGNHTHAEQQ